MTPTLANTRDAVLLSLACVGGALLAPLVPFLGLPVCAAALAGLLYRGHPVTATIAAGVAVAAAGAIRPSEVLMVAPALVAVLFATMALRRTDVITIAAWFVPVLALSLAAREIGAAWLSGLTVREYFAEALAQVTALLATRGIEGLFAKDAVDTMLRLAPAGYLLTALITAAPTLAAIVWAARRAGADVRRAARIDMLDLSPHVLWILVVGVGAAAAGRVWGGPEDVFTSASLNLLLVAKIALFVQGFAVVAAMLRAANVGRVGLIGAAILAFLIDGPTWIVSIAGLLDFWINFRKLGRDGTEGPRAAESPGAGS